MIGGHCLYDPKLAEEHVLQIFQPKTYFQSGNLSNIWYYIDFNGRRKLIEMLDVQIRLTIEDGQKVVYAECFLEKNVCRLHPIACIMMRLQIF